jgi:hemerythrin
MPLIVWTNHMSVGVKLLDNDHKRLALLINQLHDGLMAGLPKPALERVFEKLVSYTRIHHAQEEQLLVETGFQGSATHKQEHDSTIERAVELQMRFMSSEGLGSELEIVSHLRNWLFRHIQGSDQKFVSHLKAKGIDAILATRKTLDGMEQEKPAQEPRVLQGVW